MASRQMVWTRRQRSWPCSMHWNMVGTSPSGAPQESTCRCSPRGTQSELERAGRCYRPIDMSRRGVCLNHRADGWFREVKTSSGACPRERFRLARVAKPDGLIAGGVTPAELWIGIHQRALAMGALAVRTDDWEAVRLGAMQRPNGQDFRHCQQLASARRDGGCKVKPSRVEIDGRFEDRNTSS